MSSPHNSKLRRPRNIRELFDTNFPKLAVQPDGFERFLPLWKRRFVQFAAVTKIEALCRGGGGTGDDVDLLFHHDEVLQTVVTEPESLQSGLLALIRKWPGFREDAYRLALHHEANLIHTVIGQRFTLYERPRS